MFSGGHTAELHPAALHEHRKAVSVLQCSAAAGGRVRPDIEAPATAERLPFRARAREGGDCMDEESTAALPATAKGHHCHLSGLPTNQELRTDQSTLAR